MGMPSEFWIKDYSDGEYDFSSVFDPFAFRYVSEEVEQQRDALADALRDVMARWDGDDYVHGQFIKARADLQTLEEE